MKRQCIVICIKVLFTVTVLGGAPGCSEKNQPSETAAPAPVEKPVSEAELTARLQREINETQAAIEQAVELQEKLSTEVEVLQQLLEETETELATREEEVSRLEGRQKR